MDEKNQVWTQEFARRLRQSMDAIHINATELSRVSGIGKSDISNYLRAKYRPKQDKIAILASTLGVETLSG